MVVPECEVDAVLDCQLCEQGCRVVKGRGCEYFIIVCLRRGKRQDAAEDQPDNNQGVTAQAGCFRRSVAVHRIPFSR